MPTHQPPSPPSQSSSYPLPATAAVILLFTAAILHRIYIWYRLSHVPGPKWASISKLWLLRTLARGRVGMDYADVCEKYGPLARIGPNMLVTNDYEVVRRICGARSRYVRDEWFVASRFDPPNDHVASTIDERRHSELRAKLSVGYSGKEVPRLEESIDRHVVELMDVIRSRHLGRPVDFSRISSFFTLDVITDIAFGTPFEYLAKDEDLYNLIQISQDSMATSQYITIFPILVKILASPILRRFIMPSVKDKVGLGKYMAVSKQVVAERYGPDKKENDDMLGSFVRHGLTQKEAESETLLQILAGSDTTSSAIRTTLLHIMTTPRVYDTLRAEIDAADRENRLSRPIIRESEAKTLPYLQGCIYEGLRIGPPITSLVPRQTPPEGDLINGMFIPGGTAIGTSFFGIQRNKTVYGDDADVFRPERWLPGAVDPERRKRMDQSVDTVFMHGRFYCLGKTVAFIELNKVFVELLRRFDFAIAKPTQPWSHNDFGFQVVKNMQVVITERKDGMRF